jgi:uncharacterized membrane protein (DUF485 family)
MSNGAHRSTTSTESAVDYVALEDSPDFRELKRRHRSFVFPLAAAFLVWYFAYVLLADYAHDFMATPLIGNVNVGIVLGLSQFVTTFAITTWYVRHAARVFDPLAGRIRGSVADELPASGRRKAGR